MLLIILGLAAVVFVLFTLTGLAIENYQLKHGVKNRLLRFIFIKNTQDSKTINNLVQLTLSSYAVGGITLESRLDREGLQKFKLQNGDEIFVVQHDKEPIIDKLTLKEIKQYETKMFIDPDLPEGAERAYLKQFGLFGYMINFGVCIKEN